MGEIERIRMLNDLLTESDLKEARAIWDNIVRMHPNGFTVLSRVEKIPIEGSPGEFQYSVRFSEPVITFMDAITKRYTDKDLGSAIFGRIVGEAFNE